MYDEETNDDLMSGGFADDADFPLEDDLEIDSSMKFDDREDDPDDKFH